MSSSNPSQPNSAKLVSFREVGAAIFFLLIWLLPISYVGLMHDGIPIERWMRPNASKKQTHPSSQPTTTYAQVARTTDRFLNNQYRVSALFTKRITSWSEYYFQIAVASETEPSGLKWVTVDDSIIATQKPFGFRTRLKRMVASGGRGKNVETLHLEMANYIRQRWAAHDSDAPKACGVRCRRVVVPVGEPLIANPPGQWQRDAVIASSDFRHYSVFEFVYERPSRLQLASREASTESPDGPKEDTP